MVKTDVLIIGSGVSALQLAGRINRDINVIILTKSHVEQSNSYMAQGGIAAALHENDDYVKHYQDTLEAGRQYNDKQAVLQLTKEAPELIAELLQQSCQFDYDSNGQLQLGMEGSHSVNRIVHGGGDETGKRIVDCLKDNLNENVRIIEDYFVFDLLVDKTSNSCYGTKAKKPDGTCVDILAQHVVLATGGCGQVFSFTSNAETVTGDGIALAYRAGAEIVDMEFVQFHPTLLYLNGTVKGLISEAVRGEGAILVTSDGKRIMEGIHPLKDLAPRHVVSQTIYDYLQRGYKVDLDISLISNFKERFPTISALCEKNGIDLSTGKIPVAPGSHFLMGGVKTSINGSTNVENLYAIGEVACTGVHGANRLASNSLLEGLAYGKRLANWLNHAPKKTNKQPINKHELDNRYYGLIKLPDLEQIKELMMARTGIVRTREQLVKQKQWIEQFNLDQLISMDYSSLTTKQMTTVFMLITSWLITTSALEREESRGGQFRSDVPFEKDDWLNKKIVHRREIEKGDSYEQTEVAANT